MEVDPANAEQPVKVEDAIVAETEDFQIFCYTNKKCPASKVPKTQQRAAQRGLNELQKAREWLSGMGFDVSNAHMDSGRDGKKALRLQFDRTQHERNCNEMAAACRMLDHLDQGRVILPFENVGSLADGGTLVHEYVHTLQPARRDENVHWLNEMIATAIGSAWVRKRTGSSEIYEPKYSMVLDREFSDGNDDPGYGKWDYAIALGEKIGSQDGVAYLAQDQFVNAANNLEFRNGNSMALFYNKALVKSATFETFFPEYVSRFNNVEYGGPETVVLDGEEKTVRTGDFLYYGKIEGRIESTYLVDIPNIKAPFHTTFKGKAVPFAAHPMLLSLKVPPAGDWEPASNIFLAQVDVIGTSDADNLTLVREHRLAVEKHRDFMLIDGNAPPSELGFFRVVNTPAPDATDAMPFSLKISTRPVTFDPPNCFEAGESAEVTVVGMDGAAPDNWRLKVDNGNAKGLVVTPISPGKITIEIEIDSPITRTDTGIAPKAPMRTQINLGTYDVVRDDCMPPLAGNMVLSYDGELDDYWSSFGLTSHGSVHWQAVLDVKTKSPRPNIDPYGDEDGAIVYPDDGSTYQLNGKFEFISCNRSDDYCYHWTKENFSGGGAIAADDGSLNIFSQDGKVWLEATLPVTTTINNRRGEREETMTYLTRWKVGCANSGQWWTLPGQNSAYAGHIANLESLLTGTWINEDHNEIEFECSDQWGDEVTSTGRYSASMKLMGRVKVQPRWSGENR